jgi:sugar phosphate isomerase/epimerase
VSTYVSTSCLKNGSDIFKVLDIYSEIGISKVELGCVHKHIPDSQLRRIKQYGLDFLCHNYFPPPEEPLVINLSTQNQDLMKRIKEQIRHSIDFCHEMGIDLFTFHAGYRAEPDFNLRYASPVHVIPYEQAFMTFAEALAEVNEYALKQGVRIGVENHVISGGSFIDGQNPYCILYSSQEFERLWSLVPSSNLGMLLDLGHLKSTAFWMNLDKNDFIEKIKGKVLAFHVHDNGGRADDHRMVEKDSWFLKVVSSDGFKEIPMILESTGLNICQIRQQAGLIEEIRGEGSIRL